MVSIVGAGPGDVELITVKGLKRLRAADVIIYAGSLVNEAHLQAAKPGCAIYNSAKMHLEEILKVIFEAEEQGLSTVRLHTGDPSIYGALREQTDALAKRNIPFEIIPGVSAFLGAAAAMQEEFTLPDVTQTVILTRVSGRTAVPEAEDLAALSAHGATMILFLSVDKIRAAVEKLLQGYSEDTPAAVVYKATWPEEMIVRGTLSDIAEKTEAAGIRKTALIIVSRTLGNTSNYSLSKLYDRHFTTEFRDGQP